MNVVCINMLFVLDLVKHVTQEWQGMKVVALKVFSSISSNMQPRSCLVLKFRRLCTRHSGENETCFGFGWLFKNTFHNWMAVVNIL